MLNRSWVQVVADLRACADVPAARANAGLLADASATWAGRVVPRTSMHDLLFTRPKDSYPFQEMVRVAWENEVFTFTLEAEPGMVVTADRAHVASARSVLDAFLMQLVAEP